MDQLLTGAVDVQEEWFADGQFHYLSSSNLDAFAYEPATKTLRIEFHGGRRYRYFNIALETAAGLATATSPGGWFHENLRGAPFERE